MRRLLLAASLAAVVLLAGCLGSVEPATIDESSLQNQGWSEQSRSSDSLFLGMGDLVRVEYGPSGGADFAGATVATVNDLPVVDEEEQVLPRAIEQVEEQEGVKFTQPSERSLDLAQMGTTVSATEYVVEGAPAPAKAVIFTPDCPDFVIVAGFGTTSPANFYNDARNVVRGVVC